MSRVAVERGASAGVESTEPLRNASGKRTGPLSAFLAGARDDLVRSVIGRRVRPSASVADELERIFPGEDAPEIPVYEHATFLHWFEIVSRREIVALTLWGRVFLRGGAKRYWRDRALWLEECFHVLRQWRRGSLGVVAYLAESARVAAAGGDPYFDNRFEREAKAFVTRATTGAAHRA